MIYAANEKSQCFTGHYPISPADRHFKYLDFLKSQALPGPGSYITVIVQQYGETGPTRFLTFEKSSSLAQVPGLTMDYQCINNLGVPSSWELSKLTLAARQSITMNTIAFAEYDPKTHQTEEAIREELDPSLLPLHDYCNDHNVTTVNELYRANEEIVLLFNDPRHRPHIWKYIYWRNE